MLHHRNLARCAPLSKPRRHPGGRAIRCAVLIVSLLFSGALWAVPRTDHPRLWIDSSQLAELRARAVSTNPYFQFHARVERSGRFAFEWYDTTDETYTASAQITVR